MDCPACGHANREGATFCRECGGALTAPTACPQCGVETEPAQKFCDGCGARLSSATPVAPSLGAPVASAPRMSAPPSPAMPASLGQGRYHVRSFLGEGGRKRVFLAHDTRLDRNVAVGVMRTEGLDAAARQRIQREAQAMGRLGDHPHIVTVFDIGEEADQVYIVSEYMGGGDVGTHLRDAPDGRFAIEDALRIGGQVCQALEHAHARDIIHRDLKPGNVWLTEGPGAGRAGSAEADSLPSGSSTPPVAPGAPLRSSGEAIRPLGEARLGDFGLALDLERSRITQEGMMVGTVAYMPPEQALGRPPDMRSDLYALGAMLYEMVTGRTPFQGDDAVSIISQHINSAPVRPRFHNPQVSPGLEVLILQLLEKSPEDRPASAAAVRERLHQIAADSGDLAAAASGQMPEQGANRLAWGRFIGRVEELGALKAALDGALDGHGALRMVVGEPGIGKTRTTDELATYAQLRGAQVLIGRCYEGEGAPAYWPWVQIIRDHAYARDEAQLRSEMGPGAADIAEVVSDVRHRLPDLPVPPKLEPEQARFRLFDGITSFLRNAARTKPLLLVLDDLHWADKPSLLLLQFLARELQGASLLVVGTYRDVELDRKHPLSEVLGNLRRDRLYERVLLRGWTVEEIIHLLSSLAQQDIEAAGQALAAAIHRETEGNPFFCEEIIQHLVETGALYREADGRWVGRTTDVEELGIPEGVREVIGRRLSHLSNECNEVLTVGAVIGRDFDLPVLERVTELEGEALYRGLEEAETAGLAREDPHHRGRYRFSHALIRETLYEELSTPRRVRLHRRVGQALESVHAADIDARLAEVAHHFFEGVQGGGDVAKAVDYCTRAAERACAQVAHDEAMLHYERALQAMEFAEDADHTRRCELLLALSEACMDAGDRDGAREAGTQAAEAARRLGRPALLARAALAYATYGVSFGYVDTDVVARLEEALDAMGPDDSALRVRLLGRLARELFFDEEDERRTRLIAEAEAMAERLDDPAARLTALSVKAYQLVSPDDAGEELRTNREVVRLARELGLTEVEREAWVMLWRGAAELGEFALVQEAFEALAALAERQRSAIVQWEVHMLRCGQAWGQGDFAAAERLAQEALDLGRRLNEEGAQQVFTVHMYAVLYARGRVAELLEVAEAFADQFPNLPAWRASIGSIYAAAGRRELAREVLDGLAAGEFQALERDVVWLVTMWHVTNTCVYLGDAARAETLYGMLLPYAGRYMNIGTTGIILDTVSRPLGLLAAVRGQWTEAIRHLEEALVEQERLGSPVMYTRTRADLARVLTDRGRPADRARAMELANAAAGTAQELGMREVLEKALAIKLELQGIPSASGEHHTVDMLAATVEMERPDMQSHAAPDGTVTLLFTDIQGFTEMTERLGDLKMQDVLREHNRIVREQVRAHGGYEVKSEGDGFMLAFGSARKAIDCAVAMQRGFAAYNAKNGREAVAPQAGGPVAPEAQSRVPGRADLRVRIGLHTGEVIKEADDFFGKNVILAARIAGQADGGEILVSTLVRDLTASAGDLTFAEARHAQLKGLTGHFSLHPVRWT